MTVLVYTGQSLYFKICIEISMLSGFLQQRTDLSKDRYFSSHAATQESGISCNATMCSPFRHWQPEGLEDRRGQLHLHTSFSRKLSEITGGWKGEVNWSCPECAAEVIKHRNGKVKHSWLAKHTSSWAKPSTWSSLLDMKDSWKLLPDCFPASLSWKMAKARLCPSDTKSRHIFSLWQFLQQQGPPLGREHRSLLQLGSMLNTFVCHELPAYHSLETLGVSSKTRRQTFESITSALAQSLPRSETLSGAEWEAGWGSTGLVTSARPRLPSLPSTLGSSG